MFTSLCKCAHVYVYIDVCVVGSCLATKVFIGNLLAIWEAGGHGVIIKNRDQLRINQLHDIDQLGCSRSCISAYMCVQ